MASKLYPITTCNSEETFKQRNKYQSRRGWTNITEDKYGYCYGFLKTCYAGPG